MFIVRWLMAVFALPFTVLVAVPSLLLWLTCGHDWAVCLPSPCSIRLWAAVVFGLVGLLLALWTCSLFFRFGEGTAAPWDPPKRFVVRGPYRHVRNPMITGVILVLWSQTILFSSLALAGWLCLFALVNLFYIPAIEEKALARRFGTEYEAYRRHVPRWLPRRTAWKPEASGK